MSIGSISSQRYAAIDSVQNASAVTPASESADGDGSVRGHRHGGGHGAAGGIGQAVMDALQSMGVAMPPPGDSAGGPPGDDAGSDAQSASTSGRADIGRDVKKLMGALFEALQGAAGTSGTGDTAATSGTGGASGSSFAASLSTLISQAANGSASTELQDAFTKLTTDLKAASGIGTSSSSADTTLQAFLSKLQDRLGYGTASSATTTGNLISATA